MHEGLSGATRVYFIVGDPIVQVKSPAGVTQALNQAGKNAVCVPAHVPTRDLKAWFGGVSVSNNVDGIIVTVPHKFSCLAFCSTVSDRARFLGAVNTLRRNADGTWHGEMFDGLAYVQALQIKGFDPKGKSALLVGAGGAGSAIGYSLMRAGVQELAVHDADVTRAQTLIARLQGLNLGRVRVGDASPVGFDLVINATPIGMHPDDPYPIDAAQFRVNQWVGCVITAPVVTPMIAAARAMGCNTVTGADMFASVRDLMVQFLIEE